MFATDLSYQLISRQTGQVPGPLFRWIPLRRLARLSGSSEILQQPHPVQEPFPRSGD